MPQPIETGNYSAFPMKMTGKKNKKDVEEAEQLAALEQIESEKDDGLKLEKKLLKTIDKKKNLEEIQKRREEVIEAVNRWCVHTDHFTWGTLFALLGPTKTNLHYNVLNISGPGYGKDRATTDFIDALGLEKTSLVKRIDGHITPLKFFCALYHYKDSTIVIHESELILKNGQTEELFKNAFYGQGHVAWYTSSSLLPSTVEPQFEFKGNLVANQNGSHKNTALIDRCYANFQPNLNLKQIQDKERDMHDRIDMPDDIKTLLRDRILVVRHGNGEAQLTREEREEAYLFTLQEQKKLGENKYHTPRALERVTTIFQRFKLLFGEIPIDFTKKFARRYIIFERKNNLIEDVVRRRQKVTKKFLVAHAMKEMGLKKTQAYQIVKDTIEESQDLRIKGKEIYWIGGI